MRLLLASLWLFSGYVSAVSGAKFRLSNTLGDGMVLQRNSSATVVWGFGTAGTTVSTVFAGKALTPVKVGQDSVWRQPLPKTGARKAPTTITFESSDGGSAALKDVLFGDVFLCGGQSNMQYTPHSMAGMNNLTAELAAADAYADGIRFFTVGMETSCGDPLKGQTDCSKPFLELNPNVTAGGPCEGGKACRENWTLASSKALGGQAWNTFSGVCWLFGRDVYDAMGGDVPVGLISSNWGGTPVQVWQPAESMPDCNGGKTAPGGTLYNSMIAPFTVGPMALQGALWYQGESNVGQTGYYACAFPSMITHWRRNFNKDDLWFGFVQIAGYRYSLPYGPVPKPEIDHSHSAGDLRQAQLAALALDNVGMTTAIDTGDWTNVHPPDKQNPAARLAMAYGKKLEFPLFAGSKMSEAGGVVTVSVSIRAGGKPVVLTTDAPEAATQSSTLNVGVSVPRNECVTFGFPTSFPEDCGYPTILGVSTTGEKVYLNATASIGPDGSSIVFTAKAPTGFVPQASSYGRASWPRTVFFTRDTKLPVIPWFANFSTTSPSAPPVGLWLPHEVVLKVVDDAYMASSSASQWLSQSMRQA